MMEVIKIKTDQDLPIVAGMEWGNCFRVGRGNLSCPLAWFAKGVNLYVGFDKDNNILGMWRIDNEQ